MASRAQQGPDVDNGVDDGGGGELGEADGEGVEAGREDAMPKKQLRAATEKLRSINGEISPSPLMGGGERRADVGKKILVFLSRLMMDAW